MHVASGSRRQLDVSSRMHHGRSARRARAVTRPCFGGPTMPRGSSVRDLGFRPGRTTAHGQTSRGEVGRPVGRVGQRRPRRKVSPPPIVCSTGAFGPQSLSANRSDGLGDSGRRLALNADGRRQAKGAEVQERRWKVVALLATGIVIGVVMAGSPAGAHVRRNSETSGGHMKRKADARVRAACDPAGPDGSRHDRIPGRGVGCWRRVRGQREPASRSACRPGRRSTWRSPVPTAASRSARAPTSTDGGTGLRVHYPHSADVRNRERRSHVGR